MKRWLGIVLGVIALSLTVVAEPDELEQIRELTAATRSAEASFVRLEVVYHGVGRYPKGLPRWSGWVEKPEVRVEMRAEWNDDQKDSTVFLEDGRVRALRMRTAEPSGRWNCETYAVYRADGHLAFQESLLQTQDFYCSEPAGPRRGQTRLQVKEEMYVSPSGQTILEKHTFLGYENLPLKAISYQPRDLRSYSYVRDLPFWPVIEAVTIKGVKSAK